MIQLAKLPASEAERLAYAEGFTGAAELFGRIAALKHAAGAALDTYHNDDTPGLSAAMKRIQEALDETP